MLAVPFEKAWMAVAFVNLHYFFCSWPLPVRSPTHSLVTDGCSHIAWFRTEESLIGWHSVQWLKAWQDSLPQCVILSYDLVIVNKRMTREWSHRPAIIAESKWSQWGRPMLRMESSAVGHVCGKICFVWVVVNPGIMVLLTFSFEF